MSPVTRVQIGADTGRARALERLPIDSLWTGGHIASDNPSPEAIVNLARLSAVTERVMGATYNQDFAQLVDNVAAVGTVAQVAAKLTAFVEAGARHLVFLPTPGPDGDSDAIVARLLYEVMPLVAERTDGAQGDTPF